MEIRSVFMVWYACCALNGRLRTRDVATVQYTELQYTEQ